MECAGRKSEAVLEIRTLATCSLVIPSRLTACATASTALPCALCHMKKWKLRAMDICCTCLKNSTHVNSNLMEMLIEKTKETYYEAFKQVLLAGMREKTAMSLLLNIIWVSC